MVELELKEVEDFWGVIVVNLPECLEILKMHLLVNHLLEIIIVQYRIRADLFQIIRNISNDIL